VIKTFAALPVSDEMVERARNVIREALTMGRGAVVGWSGGKDGLVAGLLARDLGIVDGCCDESFYFDAQKADIRAMATSLGVHVRYYDRLGMDWLAKHQRLCFPFGDTAATNLMCEARQRKTMEVHAAHQHAEVIITGRKQDGNNVKAPIYRKGNVLMCHPIYNWRDGHVWGFLHQHRIPMPWVYTTPLGQVWGNSPWPSFRRSANMHENWRVVASIEMKVLRDAAPYDIRGAAEVLAQMEGMAA
jgi:3'-phosphoadenosine 5'-phosphosulfate sulfotransferase (PAPS reductase)/FAD synthetase